MSNLVGFLLVILGALIVLVALYAIIYWAVLGALRQYRREGGPTPVTPSPEDAG